MVIDSSAIMAILLGEPEELAFVELIGAAETRLMSPINLVETHIVCFGRKREAGVRELQAFLNAAQITIASIEPAQANLARDAFDRYGKGRHPAALNLGDCFAYALSKTSGEPLLFKGADFAKTDVVAAL
ncbi:MAG: type II toxin-antitoxin system VapC family toxin [Terricaulis sp.]